MQEEDAKYRVSTGYDDVETRYFASLTTIYSVAIFDMLAADFSIEDCFVPRNDARRFFSTLVPMKLKGTTRTVVFLLILCLNLGCDQVTKSVIRGHINYYDQHRFFNDHVTLLHVENTGAFLSLGDELVQPFRFILLTLLPVLALVGGLMYVLLKKNLGNQASIGIIFCIGGGMGNLYDRIVHGSVTDFMHIQFGALQTGIFNAADVSIMVGLGLILLDAFLRRNDNKKAEVTVAENTAEQ